jgi:hypothetical protein
MTINFPGPYELRVFYTTTVAVAIRHTQRLNLDCSGVITPGDAFSTIQPVYKPGAPSTPKLDVIAETWVDQMKAFYNTSVTFDGFELWKYAASSFDASFVSAHADTDAGSSGSSLQPAAQSIVTFRTGLGGVMKLSFMESVIVPAGTDTGTMSNASLETLVASLEGTVYPFWGRDNSFPFTRIAHYPGQNEALFRRRYRA